MTSKEKLKILSEANAGIITTANAEKDNISRSTLSLLCEEGFLTRIAAGQYILEDGLEDELFSLSIRSANIIFSHETALYLYGMSDRTPFVHSITSPNGRLPSEALRKKCKLYTIKADLFELGSTSIRTQYGNPVRTYNPERTICDILRSRSRISTETFIAALKAYSESKNKNLNLLSEYAEAMNLTNIIKTYLGVLL